MKKAAAMSLTLACGACAGWAFALAVDLARTPPAEFPAPAAAPPRARVVLPSLTLSPKEREAAEPKAAVPEDEPEKVEAEDEDGCG